MATRFAPSPENIAIEALGFILKRSPAARKAFTGIAGAGGLELPHDLSFETQAVADDDGRPDIEGHDSDLHRYIVAETKFHAGLTINQPLTYAARLSGDRPAALVFIVPAARMSSLWSELTKRLKSGDYLVSARRELQSELWTALFGRGHHFVLVSWRAVLDAIVREMDIARESDRLEDARQLAGLCERMDSEAFLPLRSEEITGTDMPRRYLQFCDLVNEVGEELVSSGLCDRKGLQASGGHGFFGRYLRCGTIIFYIGFDCAAWLSHKHSPLWLRFDQYTPPEALAFLRQNASIETRWTTVIESPRRILVPLNITPGTEKSDIIAVLAGHVGAVLAGLMASAASVANVEAREAIL
ncbi:hypothetical protein [Agrobacterium larrymoorei]|uniref:Uncharacterized protein n=1 Tax=Agrobacterium larrymoorei TaxID=160699 RepID=A0AAF0KCJ0_9HYPH|nr:hypothetical protein [Agrobacterium larrymoorei]WHA40150.1 hypothetical protein CFBP5477_009910 [Agrobacterium larrymoorei]